MEYRVLCGEVPLVFTQTSTLSPQSWHKPRRIWTYKNCTIVQFSYLSEKGNLIHVPGLPCLSQTNRFLLRIRADWTDARGDVRVRGGLLGRGTCRAGPGTRACHDQIRYPWHVGR
jgi:hypothetical protein